jgi:hypothetical protein
MVMEGHLKMRTLAVYSPIQSLKSESEISRSGLGCQYCSSWGGLVATQLTGDGRFSLVSTELLNTPLNLRFAVSEWHTSRRLHRDSAAPRRLGACAVHSGPCPRPLASMIVRSA